MLYVEFFIRNIEC